MNSFKTLAIILSIGTSSAFAAGNKPIDPNKLNLANIVNLRQLELQCHDVEGKNSFYFRSSSASLNGVHQVNEMKLGGELDEKLRSEGLPSSSNPEFALIQATRNKIELKSIHRITPTSWPHEFYLTFEPAITNFNVYLFIRTYGSYFEHTANFECKFSHMDNSSLKNATEGYDESMVTFPPAY